MKYKKILLILVFLILVVNVTSNSLDLISESETNISINSTNETEKIDAIVVFKEEIKEEILEEKNIEVKDNLEDAPIFTIRATEEEIEELKEDPNIESVEEDFKIEPPRTQVSRQVAKATVSIVSSKRKVTESILEKQSVEEALTFNQLIPWGVERVNAPNVWDKATGQNIKVAVIDSGIDYNNNDLNVKGGISFIDNDYIDNYGHGTFVSGVIAALDNDFGVIGVSPNVDLYAVKFMDENGGKVSDLIKAIRWCINNEIDIIVMSFGTPYYSRALDLVLAEAYTEGITLVAAAGNEGDLELDNDIMYPARYNSVIAVGSTDINDEWFVSSDGPDLELSAPGKDIPTTGLNNEYYSVTGSSMSAPHVVGVIALLKEKYPDLTPNEIRMKLQRDAFDLGEEGKDDFYGYGLAQINVEEEILNATIMLVFLEYLDNETKAEFEINPIKIEIIKIEKGEENIIYTLFYDGNIGPQNISVEPGEYKVNQYIGNYTYSNSYNISVGEIIVVPLYYERIGEREFIVDAPWRIKSGNSIPILFEIRNSDNNPYSFYSVIVYDEYDNHKPVITFSYSDLGLPKAGGWPCSDYATISQHIWYKVKFINPNLFKKDGQNNIKINAKYDGSSCGLDGDAWPDNVNYLLINIADNDIPRFNHWYCGDTHYHSMYTDVWFPSPFGEGTQGEFGGPLDFTVTVLNAIGLDWFTATDHSHSFGKQQFTHVRWNNFVNDCNSYSQCLIGEEVNSDPEESSPIVACESLPGNHILAYRISSGYTDDGCNGIDEPNDVITSINNQGGFAYIAHPESEDDVIFGWDTIISSFKQYSLTNYKGLEVWNTDIKSDPNSLNALNNGLIKWKDTILGRNGLTARKVFISAGSDAHGDFQEFGKEYTCCYSNNGVGHPNFKSNIFNSLENGKCYMGNNGALKFDITSNGKKAELGETLNICLGDQISLNIEYDVINDCYVKAYKGRINIDNDDILIGGSRWACDGCYGSKTIIDSPTTNTYYRVECVNENTNDRIYTNPIWVNIDTTDSDGDGLADSCDTCPTTYGTYCHGCPQPNCGVCGYSYCSTSGTPYCINYGTNVQCNSNYLCSTGYGDNYYADGGNELCRGYCDGNGNCDYAKSCYYSASCTCSYPSIVDCDTYSEARMIIDEWINIKCTMDEVFSCMDYWFNQSNITIHSPIENKIYNYSNILINISTNIDSKWIKREIDGNNVTVCYDCHSYSNNYWFSNGAHTVTIYRLDNQSNIAKESVNFIVDTIKPIITINSPLNQVYRSNNVPVDVSVNEVVDKLEVSWNSGVGLPGGGSGGGGGGRAGYTFRDTNIASFTIYNLTEEEHTLYVNAKDYANNSAEKIMNFEVNLTLCEDNTSRCRECLITDTLEEGTSKTYTVDGVDYDVSLDYVSSTECKFIINEEVTDNLAEGETYRLTDGVTLNILDITENEAGEASGDDKVTFCFSKEEPICIDSDGDSYYEYDVFNCPQGNDCDDNNADVNPGATEVCNGIDDNCDGYTDILFLSCPAVIGYVCGVDGNTYQNDCYAQDHCVEVAYPGMCGCADFDRDGYGVCPNCTTANGCEYDGNDCDNNDNTMYPNAPELCDGKDNDCDNILDNGGNALCDDGLWCNGAETCQGINGCQDGTELDCSFLNDQCNRGYCDENTQSCQNINEPITKDCGNDYWEYSCPWGNDLDDDTGKKLHDYHCDGQGSCIEDIQNWQVDEYCSNTEYCEGTGTDDNDYYCKQIEPTPKVNEPKSQDYCDRRIPFNIQIIPQGKIVKYLKYIDNADRRPRLMTLCSNCYEYGLIRNMYKSFRDGLHNLTFIAIDYDGEEYYSEPIVFFVDSSKPRISLQEPRDRSYCNGNFKVKYSEDNVKNIYLYYGNDIYSEPGPSTDKNNRYEEFEFNVPIEQYDGQTISYHFGIEDTCGIEEYRREYECTVDMTKPILTIRTPFEEIYNDRRVLFDLGVSEEVELGYIDHTDRRPRERRLCSRCDGYDREQSFQDGFHNITIYARDNAGNSDEKNITFYVDSTRPRISQTEPRSRYANGEFYVRYTEDNCNSLALTITSPTHGAGGSGPCTSGRNVEETIFQDLSSFEGEEIEYKVTITDIAGNSDSETVDDLIVDTTPAYITNIETPVDGEIYERYVYFNITLDDNATISYIDWEDRRPRERRLCSRCDGYGDDRLMRRSFSRGFHDLTVISEDDAGNTDSKDVSFTVDY